MALTVSPTSVKTGGTVTVKWTGSSTTNTYAPYLYIFDADGNTAYSCQVSSGISVSVPISFAAGVYTCEVWLFGTSFDESVTLTVKANKLPTAPTSITVPELRAGKSVTISWGSSTDPDGTISLYELYRQVDGGAWTRIARTWSQSATDTVQDGWTTVAYRVRAKDDSNAYSDYTTSAVMEVKPASSMAVNINGVERELEMYCAVDGIVRLIDGVAAVDGVGREIF